MKTVTRTALANVKCNRGRNLLSGIAIVLTTFLIFTILSIGNCMIELKVKTVNAYYPTWHMMYRGVSQENADRMKLHDDIETMGLRQDIAEVPDDDALIIMLAMDDTALKLNQTKLEAGTFPKAKKDIVVSRGLLGELGIQAEIGDEITLPYQLYEGIGLGYEERDTFRISGFLRALGDQNDKGFAVYTSMEYMKEKIPLADRGYRVTFHLAEADGMTATAVIERAGALAEDFGVSEGDVVANTEYLVSNHTDPSFLAGIAGMVLIVILAGILTIYSIYYVSMIPKVQEYGKLKAMGATKKQVRQIVSREGMLVAAVAVPAGLLLASMTAKLMILKIYAPTDRDTEFMKLQYQFLVDGEVRMLQPWIYVLTIAVALLTVWVSLAKPVRTAAKVSPVEAMRYGGGQGSKKKARKGYQDINLLRLTKASLARNKKRTAITTVTLGATGILFVTIAAILNCANPKEIARQSIEADYRIIVDSRYGDLMNPDREWSKIQQNNPLNDTFMEQVKAVPGVEKVQAKQMLDAEFPDLYYGDSVWKSAVGGLDESYAQKLEDGIIKGSVTYEELEQGEKMIINKSLLRWFPELKVGDSVRVILKMGDELVPRSFEVAAIGDYSQALAECDMLLPESVLVGDSGYNLDYYYDITVEENKKAECYKALDELAGTSEYLKTNTYEEKRDYWEQNMQQMSAICYAFLLILGGIGVMNLINTMINSIYTRKRELGMMQAIGMSERQLIRMLQMEGLFYTAGTLALSVGIGSLAGYAAFLKAKAEGMFHLRVFHYPVVHVAVLIVVVALIQILLTYMISSNFRKQSLIDRVRYSE